MVRGAGAGVMGVVVSASVGPPWDPGHRQVGKDATVGVAGMGEPSPNCALATAAVGTHRSGTS